MELKIKNARLAFCQNLFRAGVINAGDKPKFGATFILPKNDPQIATIKAALKKVATEKWGAKGEQIYSALASSGKICLRDGDEKAQYDGFEGCMYVSASASTRPGIYDTDRSELSESDGKPYAGCYVVALFDVWAQDNNYGKRINATIKGVQFFRDGDAFVGSAPAKADDFEDLSNVGDADDLV